MRSLSHGLTWIVLTLTEILTIALTWLLCIVASAAAIYILWMLVWLFITRGESGYDF